jgi:hypothetical protein
MLFIGNAGGRLSAAESYDPNFSQIEQPKLTFYWKCDGIARMDQRNLEYLDLALADVPLFGSTCYVTVTSGELDSTASVKVFPVQGDPPQLVISLSSSCVAVDQRFVISVRLKNKFDQLHRFKWFSTATKLTKFNLLSSDEGNSLVVRSGYLNLNNTNDVFVCRVTNVLSGSFANASIEVNFNYAPNCEDLHTKIYVEHCGEAGLVCRIEPMKTKLSVSLRDTSGANSLCFDGEAPIIYNLLAFSSECQTSASGQILASSPISFFKNIVLGIGVHVIAVEAVDANGAKTRVCSEHFENQNTMSISTLSSLVQNSKSSSILDPDTVILVASNAAFSLKALLSFGINNNNVDIIKDDICEVLSDLKTETFAHSTALRQLSFTLSAVSSLPGKLSSVSSLKSAEVLGRVSTTCLDLLLSGAASRDLALTVGTQLVLGSFRVLNLMIEARSRRLLSMNDGKTLSVHAVFASSRIQIYSMDAELEEFFVKEHPPTAVLGMRRLLISRSLRSELIIPETNFLNVLVSVEMMSGSNAAIDIGFVALALLKSPFSTSSQPALISPVVCFSMFNAKSKFEQRPYLLHTKFHIPLEDHEARILPRKDGSDAVERYDKCQ